MTFLLSSSLNNSLKVANLWLEWVLVTVGAVIVLGLLRVIHADQSPEPEPRASKMCTLQGKGRSRSCYYYSEQFTKSISRGCCAQLESYIFVYDMLLSTYS